MVCAIRKETHSLLWMAVLDVHALQTAYSVCLLKERVWQVGLQLEYLTKGYNVGSFRGVPFHF